MIDSIFKLLSVGLELWTHKEKNKYLDRYIKLKKAWYEENNKDQPDDAVLDNIRFELGLLVDSFHSNAQTKNTKDL